jgi:hypothetical protein
MAMNLPGNSWSGFPGIDDHEGFEIKHALQLAKRDIQQVADARGQAFEEPHVRARTGQLDMAQPLTAHAGERDFNAALIADHAAVLHALVLAAQALPIRHGAENTGTEKAIPLRLEGPVVDGFRLGYFSMRPAPDFFRRRQTDSNRIKVRNHIGSVVRRGSQNNLQIFPIKIFFTAEAPRKN